MNMNIIPDYSIDWHEDDLRPQGKDDPAFYTYSSHTRVCTVGANNRSVLVAVNGDLNVVYRYFDTNTQAEDEAVARTADGLARIGLKNDEDIMYSEESDNYYWKNNTWFDLYDDVSGEHLDKVSYSLTDAINWAVELCQEGNTEPINEENN